MYSKYWLISILAFVDRHKFDICIIPYCGSKLQKIFKCYTNGCYIILYQASSRNFNNVFYKLRFYLIQRLSVCRKSKRHTILLENYRTKLR